jgi:hypothetical protein
MHDFDAGWDEEDAWWKANYASRPYAKGRPYDELRPAYFYGYVSTHRHRGRSWDEAKDDLRTGWDKFEAKGPGGAAWENVKDAVHDAWNRLTGKNRLDVDKMSRAGS